MYIYIFWNIFEGLNVSFFDIINRIFVFDKLSDDG